jgi:hypothetical protein
MSFGDLYRRCDCFDRSFLGFTVTAAEKEVGKGHTVDCISSKLRRRRDGGIYVIRRDPCYRKYGVENRGWCFHNDGSRAQKRRLDPTQET